MSPLAVALSLQRLRGQGRHALVHLDTAGPDDKEAVVSHSVISRLQTCISMGRGPVLQIHRSFAEELLRALSAAGARSQEEVVVTPASRRTCTETKIRATRLAAKDVAKSSRQYKTECSVCQGKMFVLETRGTIRRMECLTCRRRVTTDSIKRPERA